ncbi:thiamine phosphate synthase [Vibrio vulnificus]|uniref:thiamine phosphate synthase n=1 Tax=Vibrio vulnificus TaxID=672 RepID=UPI0002F5361A|nr:thiamine phosphate synthase [Vibrio vulnificus]ASM96260.1 thiamine-phosphate pyrophosphorylase [Vibrio vulnificus NBRC 15645 = ATCC 27562]EIZ1007990.1 thiamine phosphate synthase [Vibrio vulnificus]MCL7020578.1 thiamine phosphate synthase [Vibrio vulnificus]MDK2702176.1 thiamine phosphate synthase [Vibrio vulnificus]QET75011.1 thiamine phosphate synthase [Vibrio vulnificus]
MRLLIPSAIIELTGEIQQCLLLAKQQGFAIDHIELGVSPTRTLQLISSAKTVVFETDLTHNDSRHLGAYDFALHYHHSLALTDVFTYLGSGRNAKTLLINLQGEQGEVFDVWRHPLADETRALRYSLLPNYPQNNSVESNYRHLAWVVTLSALDFPIEDCLTLARAMLNVSRETWVSDFALFPTPVLRLDELGILPSHSIEALTKAFPRISAQQLGLYPVVDDVSWIEKLLPIGIKTVQLRIKDPNQTDLEQQIVRAIQLGRHYGAQVYINDYWQLAIQHQAYGVHLGQEDLQVADLAALANAGIALGLSTHGYYELLRIVQLQPSYIALGHIFPTTTKQMPSLPQGLVRLKLYQQLIDTMPYDESITGVPTVAIGGIDQTNAATVWRCGVSSLAVVRAITLAKDVKAAIDHFKQVMVSNATLARFDSVSTHSLEPTSEANHVE